MEAAGVPTGDVAPLAVAAPLLAVGAMLRAGVGAEVAATSASRGAGAEVLRSADVAAKVVALRAVPALEEDVQGEASEAAAAAALEPRRALVAPLVAAPREWERFGTLRPTATRWLATASRAVRELWTRTVGQVGKGRAAKPLGVVVASSVPSPLQGLPALPPPEAAAVAAGRGRAGGAEALEADAAGAELRALLGAAALPDVT